MPTPMVGFPPPLSRVQIAARHREDAVIDQKYPGHYVAFLDDWTGDILVRTVLAVADNPSRFQELLSALSPDVRNRMHLTLIPEADLISAPSIDLA